MEITTPITIATKETYSFALKATLKSVSFAINPAKGGIPAKEAMPATKQIASHGH
mgnify:CR=1